jgi:hypothetical protein
MDAALESLTDALESRDQMESRVMESKVLANRVDQLGARVLEAKAMLGVKQDLAAIEKGLESRSDLASRADALASRSGEFLNLSMKLESRALDNMSARLESRNLESKSLLGIKQMVESVSKGLESRDNLESKSLASMQKGLQSFETSLASREAELNAKFALGMKSELAAINNHLENRENVGSKFELADKAGLEAKAGLESKADLASKTGLEAKAGLGSRDSLNAFNQYLGSLSRALESRGDLASREAELGSRAQELQNRASDLQSKSNF